MLLVCSADRGREDERERESSPQKRTHTGGRRQSDPMWKTHRSTAKLNMCDVWGRRTVKGGQQDLMKYCACWGADSLWVICNLATGVEARMDQRKGQRCEKAVGNLIYTCLRKAGWQLHTTIYVLLCIMNVCKRVISFYRVNALKVQLQSELWKRKRRRSTILSQKESSEWIEAITSYRSWGVRAILQLFVCLLLISRAETKL